MKVLLIAAGACAAIGIGGLIVSGYVDLFVVPAEFRDQAGFDLRILVWWAVMVAFLAAGVLGYLVAVSSDFKTSMAWLAGVLLGMETLYFLGGVRLLPLANLPLGKGPRWLDSSGLILTWWGLAGIGVHCHGNNPRLPPAPKKTSAVVSSRHLADISPASVCCFLIAAPSPPSSQRPPPRT